MFKEGTYDGKRIAQMGNIPWEMAKIRRDNFSPRIRVKDIAFGAGLRDIRRESAGRDGIDVIKRPPSNATSATERTATQAVEASRLIVFIHRAARPIMRYLI